MGERAEMENGPTLQSREGGHAYLGWEAETRGRRLVVRVNRQTGWEVEENGVGTFPD